MLGVGGVPLCPPLEGGVGLGSMTGEFARSGIVVGVVLGTDVEGIAGDGSVWVVVSGTVVVVSGTVLGVEGLWAGSVSTQAPPAPPFQSLPQWNGSGLPSPA